MTASKMNVELGKAIRIKRLTKANLAKNAKNKQFRIDEEQVEDYRDTIDYEEQEKEIVPPEIGIMKWEDLILAYGKAVN